MACIWIQAIELVFWWKILSSSNSSGAGPLLPIHKAQLLTYLRLGNKPLGLLLNFNVVHLREGIKRVLNNKYRKAIAAAQGDSSI
jgi:hypothetical protein